MFHSTSLILILLLVLTLPFSEIRICRLLSLEVPEIQIERNNNLMMEGDYKAAAYFGNDPGLRRASPIGGSKAICPKQKKRVPKK